MAYTYDLGGKLTQVNGPGSADDATFTFDALGRFPAAARQGVAFNVLEIDPNRVAPEFGDTNVGDDRAGTDVVTLADERGHARVDDVGGPRVQIAMSQTASYSCQARDPLIPSPPAGPACPVAACGRA